MTTRGESVRNSWVRASAGLAATGLAFYVYAHYMERQRVTLDRFDVFIDSPSLPARGLTILHLSDFHFRDHDPVQEARLSRLDALLNGEHYHIVAVTGDLIHNAAGLPRALAFLGELHPSIGAFFVPGNRDYWESSFKAVFGTSDERRGLSFKARLHLAARKTRATMRTFTGNQRAALGYRANDVTAMLEALCSQGILPLMNRAVNLKGENYDLWIAGIDDFSHGKPDLAAAFAGIPPAAPLVLLAHNPDVWLNPGALRADLILSGHTHGGQLRLPLLGSGYRQGTHLDRRKAAGWFSQGETRMYVSRGLGESFPFRFGAPPQAALIRLVPTS